MSVKIVEVEGHLDYAPMHKNNQFFSTIHNGEVVKTFLVNHDRFKTATQYLQKFGDYEWDYVRSATIEEVVALA